MENGESLVIQEELIFFRGSGLKDRCKERIGDGDNRESVEMCSARGGYTGNKGMWSVALRNVTVK